MEANLSVKTKISEAPFLPLKHENSYILKASSLSFILQCACDKLPFRPFLSTQVPPRPTSQWGPPNDFLYRDTTWYHRQQPAVQQQIQLCRKFVFFSYQLFPSPYLWPLFSRITSSRLQSTPCLHSCLSTSLNNSKERQTSTSYASSSCRWEHWNPP